MMLLYCCFSIGYQFLWCGMNAAIYLTILKITKLRPGCKFTQGYIMNNSSNINNQKLRLISINRSFILSLTVIGLLMDGLQTSDILFSMASLLWLWMPSFINIEMQWVRAHWKYLNNSRNERTSSVNLETTG